MESVKTLLPAEQLARRVTELGAQISLDCVDKSLVAVGILKGSFIFFADLTRAITVPLSCEFLELSDAREMKLAPEVGLQGKHILVVDDLVSGGSTLQAIQKLVASQKPASLSTCVLLQKKHRLKAQVKIDYVGFEIEDQLVVGYGLDKAGRYRELPYVGVFG